MDSFGGGKHSMRMKVAAGVLIAIAVLGTILVLWYREHEPTPPEGVRCFRNVKRIVVRPNREGWGKAGYQAVQFVKMKSGEVLSPVLRVVRPNFRGFMGGVREDPTWETTFHFLGEGQAKIEVPVHEQIDEHLILVRILPDRGARADGPWRVWTLNVNQIDAEITMPRFGSLDMYSDRKDLGDLEDLNRRGEEFAMYLGS
jgi:hypothetical protein